jgi:hypothetical protein
VTAPNAPQASALAPVDPAIARRNSRRGTIAVSTVLVALIALVVLLSPASDDSVETHLTTTKYGSGNARLLADMSRRLGWRIATTGTPIRVPLDATQIYAVFAGPTRMTVTERVLLLDAVRRGAGLLVAGGSGAEFPLLDSLGLLIGPAGKLIKQPFLNCPAQTDPLAALSVRPMMTTFLTPSDTVRFRDAKLYPAAVTTLLSSAVSIRDVSADSTSETDDDDVDSADIDPTTIVVVDSVTALDSALRTQTSQDTASRSDSSRTTATSQKTELRPTMIAFALGKGRVVAIADPDILRTDQLRSCESGPALQVVRGLEYLSVGRQRAIQFNESYQIASEDGPGVVVREWLLESKLGRALITLIAATVLLLIARGRRTLAPVTRLRDERRSALEHVDALATAWRTVRGTRTVARYLARGIRRRHAAGRWRSLDDAAFLSALAARHPAIATEAATIATAMREPTAPTTLPALRIAAAQIDAECLTP